MPRLDPGGEARLAEEPRAGGGLPGPLGAEELQRDALAVLAERLVDEPEPALAEEPPQAIGADALHPPIIPAA